MIYLIRRCYFYFMDGRGVYPGGWSIQKDHHILVRRSTDDVGDAPRPIKVMLRLHACIEQALMVDGQTT